MTVVLNDLYDYNLKIYQDEDKFKFSLDSLLLSEFLEVHKKDQNFLDLCTGNAPIPLIIGSRYPNLQIYGIEIQKEIYELGMKSVLYNHLSNIDLLNMNATDALNYFPGNNFDIISCNPPFFKKTENSLINPDMSKAIARHELTITLSEIFAVVKYLLKDNGRFYLVHRPERLEEILNLAAQANLHVKNIEFIASNPEEYAIMVLFKFVKNAKLGTKVRTTIINRETTTYQNIFERVRK